VITVSALVILIGVSSTSMKLREILPDGMRSQYTQQRVLPLRGRDPLEDRNLML
jgi:hypothetical protein